MSPSEGQQLNFSYRATPVATTSQSSFVLVPIRGEVAQIERQMLQNGVSHRYVCANESAKRKGYRTLLPECEAH